MFRDESSGEYERRGGLGVVARALALALLLLLIRGRILGFHDLPILARIPRLVLAAYYDILYVAGIAVAVLLASWAARPRTRRILSGVFAALAVFSLLAALANVRIVAVLGRPLNYQWLYYSDFLQGEDARNAIAAELSWSLLLAGMIAVAALFVVARVVRAVLAAVAVRIGWRALAVSLCGAALVYFAAGGLALSRRGWNPLKLENPIVSFSRSVVVAARAPKLLTMKTSVGTADFEPPRRPAAMAPDGAPRNAGIRNVVLFVLESVPAGYLEAYGGPYAVTPELTRSLGRAAVFTNVYAQCPGTSYSLVSLLMSIYPRISYKGLTETDPAIRFPSLSSELSRRGYRTAFFSSADLRHQQCDVFLANRAFDRLEDYRALRCDEPVLKASTENWPFLNGRDDVCIGDALTDWIDADRQRPFFAVLWTMMTHYPYFTAGPVANFGVPESFNRYFNALRHDDEVLGRILRALEARGLDRSTLVVVVGDHGEAFGQHGQWTHAQSLYEESVHVPLILVNPVFHGERPAAIGGLLDVAPTIFEVLGFEPPAPWQGRSLWSPDRSGRVYFFVPWSTPLFGLREGDEKVIYDASDDHFEVYELRADPGESVNAARRRRAALPTWRQRLAAWVQYQDSMLHRAVPNASR